MNTCVTFQDSQGADSVNVTGASTRGDCEVVLSVKVSKYWNHQLFHLQ